MSNYWKSSIFFLLNILVCGNLLGQKQTNIWYFGNGAGINFNNVPPIVLTNGAMYAQEGCSGMADSNGNIKVYSDGITAWSKNHSILPFSTGLMGGTDVTQSALLVPMPKDASKYYLFTVEGGVYSKGFRYSIVDTKLNGGIGDIEPLNKNVLLQTPISEKLAATHHANGRDIWIIVHGQEDASFYAYLLTPSGMSTTPVVSTLGLKYNKYSRFRGQLKISPSGDKIACSNTQMNITELFDFDKQTGKLTNRIEIPLTISYGCEFSPDETKLYISQVNTFSISSYGVYQFDITTWDSASISSSKFLIETQSPRGYGSLQLASDNKVYVARHNNNYIGVINDPNLSGTSSNYVADGVDLLGNVSWYGLPNFVSSLFRKVYKVTFESKTGCIADSNMFEFTGSPGYDSLVWDFGDGTTPLLSFDNLVKHHYADAGTYPVTIQYFIDGTVHQATDSVTLNVANVTINDFAGCEGYSVTVGSQTYDKTGVYKDLLNDCDTLITRLTIFSNPTFELFVTHDSCEKNTGKVVAQHVNASSPYSFQWNTGSVDSIIYNLSSGSYSLTVTDSAGCKHAESVNVFNLRNQCEFALYVPDVFSPNGDNLNDVFGVSAYYLSSFDMKIYNPWGALIYQTDDTLATWDGTYNNQPCPTGVYVVVIQYKTNALVGQSLLHRSTLQLLR